MKYDVQYFQYLWYQREKSWTTDMQLCWRPLSLPLCLCSQLTFIMHEWLPSFVCLFPVLDCLPSNGILWKHLVIWKEKKRIHYYASTDIFCWGIWFIYSFIWRGEGGQPLYISWSYLKPACRNSIATHYAANTKHSTLYEEHFWLFWKLKPITNDPSFPFLFVIGSSFQNNRKWPITSFLLFLRETWLHKVIACLSVNK